MIYQSKPACQQAQRQPLYTGPCHQESQRPNDHCKVHAHILHDIDYSARNPQHEFDHEARTWQIPSRCHSGGHIKASSSCFCHSARTCGSGPPNIAPMENISETQMPASHHRGHGGCAGCQPPAHIQTAIPTPPETPQRETNSGVNASRASQPCEVHRHSHQKNQPHYSGIQVHLHNHACHTSPNKPRRPSPRKQSTPRAPKSSHVCGHDGQTVHPCFASLKAPYPHSGRCSLNMDFPHEPEINMANQAPRQDNQNDQFQYHSQQPMPFHAANISCYRVWGPPLPAWGADGRPYIPRSSRG